MIKYILYPGNVRSKYDTDIHYISYAQLIKLYKINQFECIDGSYLENILDRDISKLIKLYPQTSGDYNLPTTVGNAVQT